MCARGLDESEPESLGFGTGSVESSCLGLMPSRLRRVQSPLVLGSYGQKVLSPNLDCQ